MPSWVDSMPPMASVSCSLLSPRLPPSSAVITPWILLASIPPSPTPIMAHTRYKPSMPTMTAIISAAAVMGTCSLSSCQPLACPPNGSVTTGINRLMATQAAPAMAITFA
ncbi:hypothetical protein D3C84_1124110 [compost metagenome]